MLEELKKLIERFESAQSKWAKTGAADSEPTDIFQAVLVRAFKGKKPTVPHTVAGWALYSETKGNGLAAAALARAAKACVQYIEESTLDEASGMEAFLRDYCWYADW